ncbi:MAG: N-acetylneuraminate synthase family protein [Nitrospirae bacterium]|nr:N-acetylneuraminate synthase family protein [Nitrospirota bacterium]
MIEIIAEIANAHQGNPETALELARAAVASGADAVKFQIYFAGEFLTLKHPRYEHFKRQAFSEEVWETLICETKKTGVSVYADIFGLQALAVAISNNIDGFKVHSSDLSNTRLLKRLSEQKRKVFLATGGSTLPEIKYAVDCIVPNDKSAEVVLLHGFQAYPTMVEDSVLSRLRTLSECFGDRHKIGYSDHVDADDRFAVILPLMAIPYGISCIEKHLTFHRGHKGVDYYSSFEPAEFGEFVADVRIAEKAVGENPLLFAESERRYRDTVKKAWVAVGDMKQGDHICDSDILMKRTSEGVPSAFYENIIGKEIKLPLAAEDQILGTHVSSKVLAIIVARMSSSRLKGKATIDINGKPAISHLFQRVRICVEKGLIHSVAFCTTQDPSDGVLASIAEGFGFKVYKGSLENVLSRMMLAVDDHPDHSLILRITGDDLLMDSEYLFKTLEYHLKMNADYTDAKQLPSGVEVEVFNSAVLKLISRFSKNPDGTEYLTNYVQNNRDQFNVASLTVAPRHAKNFRLTLDTEEDYIVIKTLLAQMKAEGKEYTYTLDDIVDYFEKNPQAMDVNSLVRQRSAPLTVKTDIDWESFCKADICKLLYGNTENPPDR